MAALAQKIKLIIEADDHLSRELGSIHQRTKTVFGKTSPTGLPNMAGAALLGVGAGAVVAGKAMADSFINAGKVAANFESQMVTVGALIKNSTAAEVDALTAKARELGATTSFSATEAAQGMQALAMAGFETNDILNSMKPLLDSAVAGSLELGQTADTVSNIMSGFGIASEETARVADVLTATFTSSNTTLESLGNTLKFAAPIAREAGTSFEDVAAAAGLLGNAGIQGSNAGTVLRGTLLRLQAPAGRAKDTIRELGIELREADGSMKPLPGLIEAIQGGLEKLNPEDQTRFIKDLIGEEALGGFQILLGEGPEKIRNYADELRNSLGRASDIASDKMNTALGASRNLASAWESLQITIGQELTPAFEGFVREGLLPAIQGIDAWLQKGRPWDAAIKGLGASLTEMYNGWLDLLHGLVDGGIDLLKDFFDVGDHEQSFVVSLQGIFDKVNDPNGPIMTFVNGWTDLVVGMSQVLWSPIGAAWDTMWTSFKDTIATKINAIMVNAEQPINDFIDVLNNIGEALGFQDKIDSIDWKPLTVDAKAETNTFWDNWERRVDDAFASMRSEVSRTALETEIALGTSLQIVGNKGERELGRVGDAAKDAKRDITNSANEAAQESDRRLTDLSRSGERAFGSLKSDGEGAFTAIGLASGMAGPQLKGDLRGIDAQGKTSFGNIATAGMLTYRNLQAASVSLGRDGKIQLRGLSDESVLRFGTLFGVGQQAYSGLVAESNKAKTAGVDGFAAIGKEAQKQYDAIVEKSVRSRGTIEGDFSGIEDIGDSTFLDMLDRAGGQYTTLTNRSRLTGIGIKADLLDWGNEAGTQFGKFADSGEDALGRRSKVGTILYHSGETKVGVKADLQEIEDAARDTFSGQGGVKEEGKGAFNFLQTKFGEIGDLITKGLHNSIVNRAFADGLRQFLTTGEVDKAIEEGAASLGAGIGEHFAGAAGAVIGEELGRVLGESATKIDEQLKKIKFLLPGANTNNPENLTPAEIFERFNDAVKAAEAGATQDQQDDILEGIKTLNEVMSELILATPQGKKFQDSLNRMQDSVNRVLFPDPNAGQDPADPVSPHQAALAYLDANIPGKVSKAKLQEFGLAAVRLAVTDLSASKHINPSTKQALFIASSSGNVPLGDIGTSTDLVAAHGFSGVVRKPTTILAGEAGPERVNISRIGAGRDPGGMGSKQIFLNINLSMLDVRGLPQFVQQDLGPMLAEYLRDQSERGLDIIFQRGVVPEVAV